MINRTGAIIAAAVLAVVIAGFLGANLSGGTDLETQTFELQYLEPHQAAELIAPYVYTDRPDASGQISYARNLVTVRETRDNLEKIGRVLMEHDTPPPSVQLHFQIIEANGSSTTDSAIADVESVLRRLFRFRGYRLLAQAMLGGIEGSQIGQALSGGGSYPYFHINAGIMGVRSVGDSGTVSLEMRLRYRGTDVFETSVNVRAGQTVVLGSTQPDPDGETLILTVRPEIVTP